MRGDYGDQLNIIENNFNTERQKILNRNMEEIKSLFDEQKQLEEDFMRRRALKEEEYTRDLEELRTVDANDQAEQKIKLEKEMQVLQRCMEDMKAVYRLNEEKLEFNYKVLNDREKVNSSQLNMLRKKLRRLRGTKSTVKAKFEFLTNDLEQKNMNMSKEYKRFTKEYVSLQKKYERFEKGDKKRFNDIWSMNQNEVMALCEKIKDCDRVIHVQQLGIPWSPPQDAIFKFTDSAANQTGGQSMMGGQNTSVMDSSKHGMSKSELVDDGQMSNSTARNENQDLKDNFFKVKNVFEILIEEAAYLIDDKAVQMCEGKSPKEKFLILIDSCRKSLNIDSMDDVELLVETFYEFGDKKKKRLIEEEERRLAEKEEQ